MNIDKISSELLKKVLYIVEESVDVRTRDHFSSLIKKVNSIFESDISMSAIGKLEKKKFHNFTDIVNVSYPQEWIDLYIEKNYQEIDPILNFHFSNFKPQKWSETYRNADNLSNKFINNSMDFNLKNGITYGINSKSDGFGSLFSFSTKSSNIPDAHIEIMKIITPHLHHALLRTIKTMNKSTNIRKYNISKREKEVLKWIKKGKTNWEISVILDISERTVKYHVSNVMKKLEAVSRAQAIAISIELGILSL